MNEIARNFHIRKWNFGNRQRLVLLQLITMRGDQVAAIHGTIDGDFAFRAATDGANLFAFGGTKPLGFSFIANWTKHILRAQRGRLFAARYARASRESRTARTISGIVTPTAPALARAVGIAVFTIYN